MSGGSGLGDALGLARNIRTTGTVAPSSKALIRQLLKPIDFGAALRIVELGPGNGCVTRALLARMAPEARLISLELNGDFAARLAAIGDPRLEVCHACASSLRAVLDRRGVRRADYVVSSLPLALIDDAVMRSILSGVGANLREGGRFLQYQYSLANYGDVKPWFSDVRLRFTLRNVPPAFVYDCVK